MKVERWRRLERLFLAASDLPPGGRTAFLDASCRDDPRLQREVQRMLDFDQRHDIIDTPVLARRPLGRGPRAARELDPPTGTMVGPYRLVERIASGGMGVIYRAIRTDELNDFEVAVKLVRRGVESAPLLERFREERQALAHLAHPNIAHLLDGGTTEDGRPYLVMEFIRGSRIDLYCDERRLSLEQRIRLFCTVCRAVHFAHQNLVVHCDLKPGNILVTDDGTPRIVDFGVAKMLDRHRRAARSWLATGDPLGTPDYASPEQVAGGPITTAVDVYALGVVLFGILAGRHPGGASVLRGRPPACPSVAAADDAGGADPGRVAAQRGTTPARLRRRLQGDLDSIVMTALRREPAQRYPSAELLARDLERSLSGRPVSVRSDSVSYRLVKFLHRHRAAVLAAALVALTLCVSATVTATMAIVTSWHRDAARAAEVHARVEAESAQALVDAFTRGGSGRTPEAITQEAEHARQRFRAEPHLLATLLDAWGRVLAADGHDEAARDLVDEALEIREREFGPHSLEVALSLRTLGRLASARGEHEAAVEHFRRALALHRAAPAAAHANVVGAMTDLAGALAAAGASERAVDVYRRAVAAARGTSPRRALQVADALAGLAAVLDTGGQCEQAREAWARSLEIRRRILGEEDPLVRETRRRLAAPRS